MLPRLISNHDLDDRFTTDGEFHRLYPTYVQLLASRHWTPLHIARMAAEFVAPERGVNVLDIGSGVGKFCLAGAYYKPFASFFGVEQRKHLIDHAEAAKRALGMHNVRFMHYNFTQLDFSRYDNFYVFNPFYENLDEAARIDDDISYSAGLYNYYTNYLYKMLEDKPAGTRLATYHGEVDEVPPAYRLVERKAGNLLKLWCKM